MSDMDRFIAAIVAAKLPLNDEILVHLGELYEDDRDNGYFKRYLLRMAEDFNNGTQLSRVFISGFTWSDTPQGNHWWRDNVRDELGRRNL